MQNQEHNESLRLTPEGRLGTSDASDLLTAIRQAEAGVEIDFSAAESVDFSIVQLMLVVVDSLRRRNQTVVVKDSEAGVFRAAIDLAGVIPEQAGLSARLAL